MYTVLPLCTLHSLIFGLALTVTLGCSSGASSISQPLPTPVVSVSLAPPSGSIQTGAALQLTAIVSGTTNLAVTWQVNGTTGGSVSLGTISVSGLYTAPLAVPTPNPVTVTAISFADSSKTASATITIAAPSISVAVSPTTIGVRTLYTQRFTAMVSNTSNMASRGVSMAQLAGLQMSGYITLRVIHRATYRSRYRDDHSNQRG